MTTKYIMCSIFHPGKLEYIAVDVEVGCNENESSEKEELVKAITYISDIFFDNNLSLGLLEDVELSNEYSQSDYVGSAEDLALRILTEFG